MQIILFALLSLLLVPVSHAAITFDAVANSPDNETSSTTSWSHTVGAGSDRLLAVCLQARGTSAAQIVASTVTFNGSALTFVRADSYANGAGAYFQTELWVQAAPSTGAGTVAVTWAGTPTEYGVGTSTSYAGVNPTAPVSAHAGGSGVGATLSALVTTVASDEWLTDCAIGRDDAGLTVGAGQTMRTDRVIGVPQATYDGVGVSTVNGKASPGVETMDWTQPSNGWVMSALSLSPSGGGAAPPPTASTATQATLTWTNGTDATGVTGATILRCIGTGCTPSTSLTTVPASNGSAGGYVNAGLETNTVYCYSVNNYDAAGNQSAYTAASCMLTGTTFRNVLATDNFDRTDATDLGAAWDSGYTGRTNCQIVSGRLRSTVLASGCTETYNAVTTPNDQWVQFTVPTLTGAQIANGKGLVRWANAPTMTGYRCTVEINPTAFKIQEVTAGVSADLASNTTASHQAGDIYRCEAEGTGLRLYQVRGTAETLLTSATDASIASGKTGVDLYMDTGGSLANMEYDLFAMGSISATATVEPTITGLTLAASGATLTFGATTPTSVRVNAGNNLGSVLNVVEPIASFPGGVYTRTWADGLTYACFFPINNLGIENTAQDDYRCGSLVGIVPALDTTPPVLSNVRPSGSLPFGTTSTIVSVDLDKSASCRMHATDVAYADMGTNLSTVSLTASGTVSGLTNGSTTTRYVRCAIVDAVGTEHPNLTSTTVTITVLAGAGADTTAPSTVTNLVATPLSNSQMSLVWSAATDNVAVASYQVYASTDACVTPAPVGLPATTTTTILSLLPSTSYCFTVKAIDTSNNLSAAHSNQATATTSARLDVEPPSDMLGMTATPYKNSVVLSWRYGTDNSGLVTTSIEQCKVLSGVDCTNFETVQSLIAGQTLSLGLLSSTRYCFRGRHSDTSGNAGGYSAIVCATTSANGLPQPRTQLPFGQSRSKRN